MFNVNFLLSYIYCLKCRNVYISDQNDRNVVEMLKYIYCLIDVNTWQ